MGVAWAIGVVHGCGMGYRSDSWVWHADLSSKKVAHSETSPLLQ